MVFTLRLTLGMDAMRTGSDLARTLRQIADDVEVYGEDLGVRPRDSGPLRDRNGNTVGHWRTHGRM